MIKIWTLYFITDSRKDSVFWRKPGFGILLVLFQNEGTFKERSRKMDVLYLIKIKPNK